MDKIIERGLLFDFYGELLTEHQQRIYSEAVFNDLSLGEISEEEGISRQGVHDLIKRCDRLLESYEDKLKLIDKFQKIKNEIADIDKMLDCSDEISDSLKLSIKDGLKTIIEDL